MSPGHVLGAVAPLNSERRPRSSAGPPPETSSAPGSRPATPAGRMQQQLARQHQRRRERLQGTTVVFTGIEIRDGGESAQVLPQPPLLSATGGYPSAMAASSRSLSRTDSEAAGVQVLPWRTPTSSPRSTQDSAGRSNEDAAVSNKRTLSSNGGSEITPVTPSQQAPLSAASRPGTAEDGPQREPFVINLTDTRQFVNQPGPCNEPLQCRTLRQRVGTLRAADQYILQLDNGGHFLLAARKRKKSKCSNYLISLEQADLARHSAAFCGKVRSNFLGTEFTCYDSGISPAKASGAIRGATGIRSELAAVVYNYNVLGTQGPRKMTVLVPSPDVGRDGAPPAFQPEDGNAHALIDSFKQHARLKDMVLLRNKPPKWNEQLGAYCLNFGGRVTAASVKNFQLMEEGDPSERVVLQYGKTGKDMFSMDYAYPLTALQAFSICMSSFDRKMGCE